MAKLERLLTVKLCPVLQSKLSKFTQGGRGGGGGGETSGPPTNDRRIPSLSSPHIEQSTFWIVPSTKISSQ
jgi:hypothetical protein